jgi:hypothetical protein
MEEAHYQAESVLGKWKCVSNCSGQFAFQNSLAPFLLSLIPSGYHGIIFKKKTSASSLHSITPSVQVLLAHSHVIISSESMLYIKWVFKKKERGREPEERGGGGRGRERERERERAGINN